MSTPTHRPRLAPQDLLYPQPQNWDAIVARHQEIYEELMANHELPGEPGLAGQKTSRRPASARELTRDLAGWTPQLAHGRSSRSAPAGQP